MKHVQIVKREPESEKWEFVAHGAVYEKGEADNYRNRLMHRGCSVRFLPVARKDA